jgi:predicted GIY-YIG superfamily endonuclease
VTSPAEVQASDRTALYRLYDEDDDLLYVGITRNPERRWAQHAAEKSWWSRVIRRDVEWFETRPAALAAEEAAIALGRPAHNIDHNPAAPVVISVEIPGRWLAGLDILRRDFLGGQPCCSRDTVLKGLLARELAARGLWGEPHCFQATCASWPVGLTVPEPCGQCFCCQSWNESEAEPA